ncbi:stage III sporulation protein AA [Xylanibacillus composti]|uniref:Stage III sporulation protein AA n=1 Tax=Xylanibacillus composti TaxID=1572762 RepID=A0A8J4H4A5_9BACL|nr:stage III sporulation protein AA [Xylanibacillus composti]MDT9726278.1 stage III sporulation protein AA [Xylanibacillus composti]GIQ70693.1 stage III sporulation protein AA [Xylanibacillus composti]
MIGEIGHMLPDSIRAVMGRVPAATLNAAEELRIRENRPMELSGAGRYGFIQPDGQVVDNPEAAYRPGREECIRLVELLTNHSLYALEEELRRGFITVRGGHRVGLAGRTVLEQGRVKQIRDVGGVNIRLARQVPGCAQPLWRKLANRHTGLLPHMLLLSSPQKGKTTVIRDLARMISSGSPSTRTPAKKVAIIDERSEIAACYRGVPVFDVGPRTDVLDGCPKAEGMMMMIRSMSPEVLVVDEIGGPEDAHALEEAMRAGVRVVATAHAGSLEEALARPALQRIFRTGVFERLVWLERDGGGDPVFAYFDSDGRPLEEIRAQIGGYRVCN